jgi:tryptophan synthase beta subunit
LSIVVTVFVACVGGSDNSIGLNAGANANTNSAKLNRVSLDYTNNKHNSKTKVLATLGSGNIQIALSVLTICWMAEAIMPDFLISLAICILPFLVSSLVSISPFKPL